MNTGIRIAKFAGIIVLCLAGLSFADGPQNQPAQPNQPIHKRAKKPEKPEKPELPPLPSGPTGKAVPQVPLDSIPAVAPQVDYQHGELTINAPNSTLGDILRAVRKQTGADIDVPDARERVVTHLGPGPARQVVAELLNGSRFNYVMLGSPSDPTVLTRIVLVAKTPEPAGQSSAAAPQQAAMGQTGVVAAAAQPADTSADAADAETAPEENAEESNQDQAAAEAEQPTATPDQNGVKTPQQLLQEMQQRQLQMQQQMQQQQQNGQSPAPATPRSPQQNE